MLVGYQKSMSENGVPTNDQSLMVDVMEYDDLINTIYRSSWIEHDRTISIQSLSYGSEQ